MSIKHGNDFGFLRHVQVDRCIIIVSRHVIGSGPDRKIFRRDPENRKKQTPAYRWGAADRVRKPRRWLEGCRGLLRPDWASRQPHGGPQKGLEPRGWLARPRAAASTTPSRPRPTRFPASFGKRPSLATERPPPRHLHRQQEWFRSLTDKCRMAPRNRTSEEGRSLQLVLMLHWAESATGSQGDITESAHYH